MDNSSHEHLRWKVNTIDWIVLKVTANYFS